MKRSAWKAVLLLVLVVSGDAIADPAVAGNGGVPEAPVASVPVRLRLVFKPGPRTLYTHEVNSRVGMGKGAGKVRFHMLDEIEASVCSSILAGRFRQEFDLQIAQTFLAEGQLPPAPDAGQPKASYGNPESGRSAAEAPGEAAALTPPAGSPERTAIMDVLRFDFYKDKDAARKNEKKVLFVLKHLKVKDGWACVHGQPTQGGKEVAEPRWAVLRKTNDGWVDVDYLGKLRPFATEAEAMDALDLSKEMVKRLLPKLPGCPAEIFP